MVKLVAAAVLWCVAVLAGARRVDAHPLHTSFTEITRDRNSGRIVVSVRLFADDFGSALDAWRARPGAGSLTAEVAAQRYVEQSVWVSSAGKRVRLEWCGMRMADGLTWICVRSTESVRPGQLRLRNTLMFDRFADQIGIVRWTGRSGPRTLVLSANAPEAVLE